MSKYIIGIDSGGTKTLGILFNKSGAEVKRTIKGFGNFNVSEDLTIKHLREVIDELILNISTDDLLIIQIGIAGYSTFNNKKQLIHELQSKYKSNIYIVTDAELALYSLKRDLSQKAILILGGTGSVIIVGQDKSIKYFGGFGHLLGDEGSSYHLVISALKNIIRQYEENSKVTPLTRGILNKIGASSYLDIKKFIYNNNKKNIAELSLFIADYALDNDQEAIKLFKEEGIFLAKQTINAYKSLNTQEEVLVGTKGGFLLNAPFVKQTLIEELDKNGMKYTLDNSSIEPAYGAYYLAMKNLSKR